MQRVSGGYTIIEVIIFLTVSAIIFVAAVNLISGHQAQVEFDTTVRNTQTKIEDWINDVATGFTGGDPSQLNCTTSASTGRPVINPAVGPKVPDCIFEGKAIQFTDLTASASQSSTIYAYSIFGNRLHDKGQLANNMFISSPIAATGPNGGAGSVDLTESFSLGTTQVKSVTSSGTGPLGATTNQQYHLIGFFNSFNTGNNTSTNGSEDVNVYQFRFDDTDNQTPGNQVNGGTIRGCMSLSTPKCMPAAVTNPNQWPESLQSLQVCLTDGKRTALLSITSVNGVGAATDVSYVSC